MTEMINFRAACAPLIAAGHDEAFVIPGIPPGATLSPASKVKPEKIGKVQGAYNAATGLWMGRTSGYDQGRPAKTFGRTAEQVEAEAHFPTRSVLIVGQLVNVYDVDGKDQAFHDLAMQALNDVLGPDIVARAPRRVRDDARHRASPIFAAEVPGSVGCSNVRVRRLGADPAEKPEQVEVIGRGGYFVAPGSPHPDGFDFHMEDNLGRRIRFGGIPGDIRITDLPVVTAAQWEAVLKRFAELAPAADYAVVTAGAASSGSVGSKLRHDQRAPVVTPELFRRVLAEIECDSETMAPHNQATGVYASFYAALGSGFAEIRPDIEDWGAEYDGNRAWVEDLLDNIAADGVTVTAGGLANWVKQHGSPELAEEVQAAVDAARGSTVQGAFAAIEEDEEDPAAVGEPPPLQVGRSVPNLRDTLAFLRSRTEWRGVVGYCQFRHGVILRRPVHRQDGKIQNDFMERPWVDADLLDALVWCQAILAKLKDGVLQQAIELFARDNAFHPVRDYLESLAWDGVKRLDTWLAVYAGATLPEGADEGRGGAYLAAVGRMQLIAAVARVMEPGCKVDTIVVLEGRQGVGKSSLIRTLTPNPDWFSDNLPHDLTSKDAKQHPVGKWLLEMQEVAQFRRNEAMQLKGYLSTQRDIYRPPYGKNEVTFDRQCVFFGTTNEDEYLHDDSGARRVLPVKVAGPVDIKGLERVRDQLWAEAVEAFRRREDWWISDASLLAVARAEQADRQASEPWDAPIAQFLRANTGRPITTAEVLEGAVRIRPDAQEKRDELRAAGAIKRAGWTKRRMSEGGDRQRVWMPPPGARGDGLDAI
jgi:hypothetical protein